MIIAMKSNASTRIYVHTTQTHTNVIVIIMISRINIISCYEIKCKYTHVRTYNINTHKRNSYNNNNMMIRKINIIS